jgi:hypothetical protein
MSAACRAIASVRPRNTASPAVSKFLRASAAGVGQAARGLRPSADGGPGDGVGRGGLGHRIVTCQGAAQRAQPFEGA